MSQVRRRALALLLVTAAAILIIQGGILAQDATPSPGASPVGETDLMTTGADIFARFASRVTKRKARVLKGSIPRWPAIRWSRSRIRRS